jgi:hypothetical protein
VALPVGRDRRVDGNRRLSSSAFRIHGCDREYLACVVSEEVILL